MKNEPGTVEYHLGELEIIRNQSDPRRAVPVLNSGESRVLDVGCGIGQTLLAPELQSATLRCGVDPDVAAIQYGRAHFPELTLEVAGAERLPFPDGHFDLVFSRVALPYTDLGVSLDEIARVLRPGGRIWAMMHTWNEAKQRLMRGLRQGSVKNIADTGYVIINSAIVCTLGRSIARPWSSAHESFQTRGAMNRLLRSKGFRPLDTRHRQFIIEACKN